MLYKFSWICWLLGSGRHWKLTYIGSSHPRNSQNVVKQEAYFIIIKVLLNARNSKMPFLKDQNEILERRVIFHFLGDAINFIKTGKNFTAAFYKLFRIQIKAAPVQKVTKLWPCLLLTI